jgi:hypothetical protein
MTRDGIEPSTWIYFYSATNQRKGTNIYKYRNVGIVHNIYLYMYKCNQYNTRTPYVYLHANR